MNKKLKEAITIIEKDKEHLYSACYQSKLTDNEINELLELVDFGYSTALNQEYKLNFYQIKNSRAYTYKAIRKFISKKLKEKDKNRGFLDNVIKIETTTSFYVIKLYQCLEFLDMCKSITENYEVYIFDNGNYDNCILFVDNDFDTYHYYAPDEIIFDYKIDEDKLSKIKNK